MKLEVAIFFIMKTTTLEQELNISFYFFLL